MRATLRAEVEGFLRRYGPARSTDIAAAVRARRADVDRLLVSGGFRRTERPEGADPRATYWIASPRVRVRNTARARLMLELLGDGGTCSRAELVAAGVGNHPNNAAAELRQQGYEVRSGRRGGVYVYWIEPPGEEVAA